MPPPCALQHHLQWPPTTPARLPRPPSSSRNSTPWSPLPPPQRRSTTPPAPGFLLPPHSSRRRSARLSSSAPADCTTPSDDDYEATVIANIHVQVAGVRNIHSLVTVTLDVSSAHYAWWRDNVLLTLERYSLFDHVLLDTTSVGVPAWDRMDIVINSWIWGTISPDLQDNIHQRGHTARDAWLALENHFLGN
jgi:hypothetical protein